MQSEEYVVEMPQKKYFDCKFLQGNFICFYGENSNGSYQFYNDEITLQDKMIGVGLEEEYPHK